MTFNRGNNRAARGGFNSRPLPPSTATAPCKVPGAVTYAVTYCVSRGDQAGSEASPGVLTSRSFWPVMRME